MTYDVLLLLKSYLQNISAVMSKPHALVDAVTIHLHTHAQAAMLCGTAFCTIKTRSHTKGAERQSNIHYLYILLLS